MQMIICSKCGLEKPKHKQGLQCYDCVRAWHKAHYQKPEVKKKHLEQGRRFRKNNPQKELEYALRSRLKTIYKITMEEYKYLLDIQAGKCAICGSTDPRRTNALRLFVDHDHATNKVRGLLCHPCNLLIGQASDNISILDKAKKYLADCK